jgi:hypothetical protein
VRTADDRTGQSLREVFFTGPGKLDLGPSSLRKLEADLNERRMNDAPTFTYLEKRQTFVKEALVVKEGLVARRAELLRQWQVPLDQLLEIAITHELGHAICHETDEAKADRYGRVLRERGFLVCALPSKERRPVTLRAGR